MFLCTWLLRCLGNILPIDGQSLSCHRAISRWLIDSVSPVLTGWQGQSTDPWVRLSSETGNDLSSTLTWLGTANAPSGQHLMERHGSFVIAEQDKVAQSTCIQKSSDATRIERHRVHKASCTAQADLQFTYRLKNWINASKGQLSKLV